MKALGGSGRVAPFIILLLSVAGCPVTDTGAIPGSTLPAGSTTAGTSTNSGEESLSARFPACLEPADAEQLKDEILRQVNQVRVDLGLTPVTQDDTLEAMAEQYACEMIQFDFFDHVNPITDSTLDRRADEFSYDFLIIGENLAAGQQTAAEAFAAWMDSPGHRENILDPRFRELGVGVRSGGRYGLYWVQEFGQEAARNTRP